MKKLTIIIVALGLLAACNKQSDDQALPQSNENNSNHETGLRTTRPFAATLNAVVNANSTNPPTGCSGDLPGFAAPDFLLSGTSTHLGLINAQVSNLHHVACDLSFATALLTTNVRVDLVAANGDVLHCTGNDVVNVANLLGLPGSPTITGTWNIDGGTGRFIGASGSFTINGLVDFAANTFNCVCAGTIIY